MNILQTVILSIVEGVTEFLPISSTGHMIVVSDFINIPQTESLKVFEVVIQLSSILAIAIHYRDRFNIKNRSLMMKTVIASIPVAVTGFIFADIIKSLFTTTVVAVMFVIGGMAFLYMERKLSTTQKNTENNQNNDRVKSLDDISHAQAIKIGIWQTLALIPGTSRSGSTIFGGLVTGLSRQTATEFSFLLAIPVMVMASGYDIIKHIHTFTTQNIYLIAISSLISFITAYITVGLFIKYIKSHNFNVFGIYRIVFGLALLFFYI